MLARLHEKIEDGVFPQIKLFADGKLVVGKAAFPMGTVLSFEINLPRRLGASGIVMRLNLDGEESYDVPFSYDRTESGEDFYTLELNSSDFGMSSALVYYELLFLRGWDTLFTSSINIGAENSCDKIPNATNNRFSPPVRSKYTLFPNSCSLRTTFAIAFMIAIRS